MTWNKRLRVTSHAALFSHESEILLMLRPHNPGWVFLRSPEGSRYAFQRGAKPKKRDGKSCGETCNGPESNENLPWGACYDNIRQFARYQCLSWPCMSFLHQKISLAFRLILTMKLPKRRFFLLLSCNAVCPWGLPLPPCLLLQTRSCN